MRRFTKTAVPNCFSCTFKTSCFFNRLEPAAQKAWNGIRMSASLPDGQDIYSEHQNPEGVFVVCKGRVKIFTTDPTGQQMIIWIRHPGEMFGHIALFAGTDYLCNSRTMGATVLSCIDSKTIKEFLNSFPKTYPLLLRSISNEVRCAHLKLKDTAYKPAKSRIALVLINAISYRSKNTSAPAIHGLKRTEIAEITGLALETVVRALAELEKKKIIKRETKAIKITNYPALLKLAS